MKRSEMLYKISKFLYDHSDVEFFQWANSDWAATELLDMIEEAGMLPPPNINSVSNEWMDDRSIYAEMSLGYAIEAECVWESEDDK